MNLKLKNQFKKETKQDIFTLDKDDNLAFTEAYVEWLEEKINSRIGSGLTSEKLEQIDKNVDKALKELKDSFSEKTKKQ